MCLRRGSGGDRRRHFPDGVGNCVFCADACANVYPAQSYPADFFDINGARYDINI